MDWLVFGSLAFVVVIVGERRYESGSTTYQSIYRDSVGRGKGTSIDRETERQRQRQRHVALNTDRKVAR